MPGPHANKNLGQRPHPSHAAPKSPRRRPPAAIGLAVGAVVVLLVLVVRLARCASSPSEVTQDIPDLADGVAATSPVSTTEAATEEGPADDETPLETGADAKVVDHTDNLGIVSKAPEGFVETPTYTNLQSAVSAFQDKGYRLGFVLTDIKTGRTLSLNADSEFYPASCVKAAYCTMVVESNGGFAGMEGTIETTLVDSSNEGFHSLISAFGLSAYGDWFKAHGAETAGDNAYVHYYPDMTPNELASVWRGIYDFGTSGKSGAGPLGDLLGSTNHSAIGGLLRDEYVAWSKPGWYPEDGTGCTATNDAGVVFSDCGDYVIVVMSNASEDFDALFPVIDALNAAHGKMCGGHSTPLLTSETKLSGE